MDRRRFLAASAALIAAPAFADTPSLRFRELYLRGKDLSPTALSLNGQRITMIGYMAPPLKPEIDFFVLTKTPMATCPFCDDAADWPNDIVLSFFDGGMEFTRFSNLIRVEGVFDTGIQTDPGTGFVSKVRLLDATYTRL